MKRPIDMTDDELRTEIVRCDFRAVNTGETMGETMGGPWSQEARRLRRVLRSRAPAQDREG